jgi:uncharacterized protein (DUF1800 family)
VARGGSRIEHLLRRAGFGASTAEVEEYALLGHAATLDRLLDFENVPDVVDDLIGQPGHVGVTVRGGPLQPATTIDHARQRWLFRMVHTTRPLQEKMTLFWHHHFATAYSKINMGLGSGAEAARVMAAKPSEDPGGVLGQIERFRQHALGNFRDLLIEVARDPAMLVWLDGRMNYRARPQENFARELLELFTMGVGFFNEQDVYAGARVFTGWNLRRIGGRADPAAHYEFFYDPNQHETSAKEFSFPIYPDGGRTIPARSAASGMQDGIDLITAVAGHPETPRRLARRLYSFFVSEIDQPSEAFLDRVSSAYFGSNFSMRAVMRAILTSPDFQDSAHMFARYSWPVEYVVRSIKEVGWVGFSVGDALTPLTNMGQQLFEPPDVNGWETGRGWFSTGGMLARMNFAYTLVANQRFNLRDDARVASSSPQELFSWTLDRLAVAPFDTMPYNELLSYTQVGLPRWTGSDQDLLVKTAGLVHLILGSSEYQFV